ncbi:MAG: recombinase family protein [Pseudomonadota bacterium]
MKQTDPDTLEPQSALIYCRVSSVKQRLDGTGLESQEQRCRAYASNRGYEVEAVFPDDVSGGGDFMKRPGMVALLSYLDAQPHKNYVIIFDDLKRLARDRYFHWVLRQELAARKAVPKCLNFNFEDTPEGEFVETILAAQGHLEREQNRRQVIQKMKARIESGYAVFHAAVGYKYIKSTSGGGKLLVPDEPLASVVREALEGFASGRFGSQAEVQRFLQADPHFPKGKKDGLIRPMTVTRLLKKVVYAGYVEAPTWEISALKGKHQPLISLDTFERIQAILNGNKRSAPHRADYDEDFPLRGFVLCGACGNAMTAAWSTGCRKRYPYYRCMTRGCAEKSKSIPRVSDFSTSSK